MNRQWKVHFLFEDSAWQWERIIAIEVKEVNVASNSIEIQPYAEHVPADACFS